MLWARGVVWRLGRALYLRARQEARNDLRTNGERCVQAAVVRAVRSTEKAVVFDVGANVGEWTESLLEVAAEIPGGGSLEVHAFEPVPETFAACSKRIAGKATTSRVFLRGQALSSTTGEALMFVGDALAGTNSLESDGGSEGRQRVSVQVTTADAYALDQQVERIHLLKVDAEGHDFEVLLGASGLFAEERISACQFEYNHRWVFARHFLKDVFDRFAGTPYQLGRVTPRCVALLPRWHPELERYHEANYLLVHRDVVGWFSAMRGDFDRHNVYRPCGADRRD